MGMCPGAFASRNDGSSISSHLHLKVVGSIVKKIQVVGHGIDTDHFQPVSDENERTKPFTILYCGRLDPVKRLELLFSAAENLSELVEFPWQLLIVGAASPRHQEYAENLRKTSQQRLGQRIRFQGSRMYQDLPSMSITPRICFGVPAVPGVWTRYCWKQCLAVCRFLPAMKRHQAS